MTRYFKSEDRMEMREASFNEFRSGLLNIDDEAAAEGVQLVEMFPMTSYIINLFIKLFQWRGKIITFQLTNQHTLIH